MAMIIIPIYIDIIIVIYFFIFRAIIYSPRQAFRIRGFRAPNAPPSRHTAKTRALAAWAIGGARSGGGGSARSTPPRRLGARFGGAADSEGPPLDLEISVRKFAFMGIFTSVEVSFSAFRRFSSMIIGFCAPPSTIVTNFVSHTSIYRR